MKQTIEHEKPSQELLEAYEIELNQLLGIVLFFVIIGIAGAIGLQIMGNVGSTFTANSASANATNFGILAIGTIFQYLPTIALVIVAGIVIYVLVKGLGGAGRSQ